MARSVLHRNPVRWSLVALVAVPALVYVATAGYLVLVPGVEDYARRQSFDAALWQTGSQAEDPEWPVRLRMVDDLIDARVLDGLTRREVESILGRADDTEKWRDWDLVYWLGPERGGMFRIDSDWLVIRFGADGRVAAYQVVTD